MLLALWSPKGGSGTSIVAAACAVVLARHCGARLVDLDGDQPAIFGLAAEPDIGILDWLALGPEAPTDALNRVALHAAPGLALIPRGVERTLAPTAGELSLQLDLPAGHFVGEWLDTKSCSRLERFQFTHAGGRKVLEVPGFEEDIAVTIRR